MSCTDEEDIASALEVTANLASRPASPLSSDFGAVGLLTSALETECVNTSNAPEGHAPSPNSNSEPVNSEIVETPGPQRDYGTVSGPDEVDNLDNLDYELEGKSNGTLLPDTQLDYLMFDSYADTQQPEEAAASSDAAIDTQTPVLEVDRHGNAHATRRVVTPAGANPARALPICQTKPPVQVNNRSGLNVTDNVAGTVAQVHQSAKHGQHQSVLDIPSQPENMPMAVPSSTATGATQNRGVKRKKGQEQELEFFHSGRWSEFPCSKYLKTKQTAIEATTSEYPAKFEISEKKRCACDLLVRNGKNGDIKIRTATGFFAYLAWVLEPGWFGVETLKDKVVILVALFYKPMTDAKRGHVQTELQQWIDQHQGKTPKYKMSNQANVYILDGNGRPLLFGESQQAPQTAVASVQ